MRKNIIWLFSLILLGLCSCNKEPNIDNETKTPDVPVLSVSNSLLSRSSAGIAGLEMNCFQITYPFSLVDIDGKQYTVSSDDDYKLLDQDSTIFDLVDFVYPISILANKDPMPKTIVNLEGLIEAFSKCTPVIWTEENGIPAYLINEDNSCFTLQYPISLKNDLGNIVVANGESELNEHVANDLYYFVFPITVNKNDGAKLAITDINALFDALLSCNHYNDSIIDPNWLNGFNMIYCYELQFPCTVNLVNNTMSTLNGIDELNLTLLQGRFESYGYPITLKDSDGVIHIAENELAFNLLLDDCNPNPITSGNAIILFIGALDSANTNVPCYTIQFPITLESYADTSFIALSVVNDIVGFAQVLTSQNFFKVDVKFPVNLIIKDGTLVTIKNEDELIMLIEQCD
jgi:hypothetical protein